MKNLLLFTVFVTLTLPNIAQQVTNSNNDVYNTVSIGSTVPADSELTLMVEKSASLPVITTNSISAITTTSATCGGNITDDGGASISERGVCYNYLPTPTISNNKTISGTGTGNYTCAISFQMTGALYYIRAYATNSAGTSYGNELTYVPGTQSIPIVFNPDLTYNSVSDINGNVYKTIQIGTQIWMAESLRSTKYRNGDNIPCVVNATEWFNLTSGAYTQEFMPSVIYGRLYNYYAIADSRNLCPTGWHMPTDDEWTTLSDYLGGLDDAGGKLKEAGRTHWTNMNVGATNETGFTALGQGIREASGGNTSKCAIGIFWSSTEKDANYVWTRYTYDYMSRLGRYSYGKKAGLSVRCVKDDNSVDEISVTFNVGGGSVVPSLTVSKNTTITKPADPTKIGYTFAGWYKEASCTNAWNFATDVVTTNITLFAKWTVATFVENRQVTDFKLYPNPAKDKLYINFNSSNLSGAIYDLQGKRVVDIKTGINPIDISNLSKGIYFVKIINSGNIIVDKLIKE